MTEKRISFKFSMLPGDLINALPGMREVCRKYNCKADIFLGLNIEWQMTDQVAAGRINKVTLTEKSMEMLKPLLLSQSWINSVQSLEAAHPEHYNKWCAAFSTLQTAEDMQQWYVDNPSEFIDLDRHHVSPLKLQYSNIFRWNFYIYPEMTCDLSEKWLEIEDDKPFKKLGAIVINRTKRSQNSTINYRFLKQYEHRLVFIGHKDEYVDFCTMYDLKIAHPGVDNFLGMAQLIRSCSFFIGNQSLCFSIAEALKVPRVLEVCPYLPNVIPSGDHGYDFLFQSCFEKIVKQLAGPTQNGYNGDSYSQIE